MTQTLQIDRAGPVARVFLNRPEVRNAFNDAVIAELTQAFAGFAADETLRAVVLGGHGKAFCAGADLAWMRAMADYTWKQNRDDAQALADMLYAIWSCPVPVVGRVHGDAYVSPQVVRDAQSQRGLADAGRSDEDDDAAPPLQQLVDRGQVPGPTRQPRRGGQLGRPPGRSPGGRRAELTV